MRKYCEENERIKRRYMAYLKHAKGQDQKSIDKVAAALVKFEQNTSFKPFKRFHIDQAGRFKTYLEKARHPKTGKPLSFSTIDSILRLVKSFFHWLAGQPGYKSRINYPDVEYFNNNAKNARVAHARRDIPFPSMEASLHAFQAMPDATELEMRDKAIFAFLMLTGARDGAVASLKTKHINLFDSSVFQDGREVKTKNGKTFTTWFLPVGSVYWDCFEEWITFLLKEKLFGPEDALFPKPERTLKNGCFVFEVLSRDNYSNATKINAVIRNAFAMVQLPQYTAHSIRKTLGLLMNDRKLSLEAQKSWSQNLGHENFITTVSSYLPVSSQRQAEIIKGMGKG
ncbi:MAG: tyrosine-type recombinase/integrase [Rhizobiaceae bacterium]